MASEKYAAAVCAGSRDKPLGLTARRVTSCHLSQLLSHPAVLVRRPAVASCRLEEFVPITIAEFGRLLVCLRGSVLTVCGFVQVVGRTSLCCPRLSPCSLGLLARAECLFDGPPMQFGFGLGAVIRVGHYKVLISHPQDRLSLAQPKLAPGNDPSGR